MTEKTLPTFDELYPNNDAEGLWHKAHEPYLRAVAEAFDAVNLTVVTWWADGNDPRDGAIELDPNALQTNADVVHVAWKEEGREGWVIVKEYERDGSLHDPYRDVVELDCCTVASPDTLVREVRGHFGVPSGRSLPDTFPDEDFPDHEFDDRDVAFELALRRYHPEVPS